MQLPGSTAPDSGVGKQSGSNLRSMMSSSRFVPLWRSRHPIVETGNGVKPLIVDFDAVRSWIEAGATSAFLGADDGVPHFMVALPETATLDEFQAASTEKIEFSDLRSLGTLDGW